MEETKKQDSELSPEQQLAELAVKQAALTQKIAEAKSSAAQRQILAMSEAARKRSDAEEQERLVLNEIKERRKQREAEAQREADRITEESQRNIAQRNAKALEEKKEREKAADLKEKVREENAKAYALEMELQKQLLDLDETASISEDSKPATLSSMPSPLAKIFFPQSEEEIEKAASENQGFSSEQNAQRQAKLDSVTNILEFGPSKSVIQTEQPAPLSAPVQTARKVKPMRDDGVSGELEVMIKPLFGQANVGRCDVLASTYNRDFLVAAVRDAIATVKDHPCGHDVFFGRVEAALESNA